MRYKRALLLTGYALFCVAYAAVFIALSFPHPIAILPLFLWILVHFTWSAVSYECCVRVDEGMLLFLRLYGKRERVLHAFPVGSVLSCKTASGERATHDLRADPTKGEGYFATVKTENGTLSVLFDASDSVLRLLRYYNKAAFRSF